MDFKLSGDVNTILFEANEIFSERLIIPTDDDRAIHIRGILRAQEGDTLRVGKIGGELGQATIHSMGTTGIGLTFHWQAKPAPPYPIHLLIGLPRPPTARKILTQCTTQGVAGIHFFQSELGEKSYAQSPLWQSEEWRERTIEGASQANSTYLPEVRRHKWLREAVEAVPESQRLVLQPQAGAKILLEAAHPEQIGNGPETLVLAIGAERGWTDGELDTLAGADFQNVTLGERILRVETAAVAAVAIAIAARQSTT